MNVDTWLMALFGVVLSGVGWWVKNIWAMVAKQQDLLSALHVDLAKNYMPRSELEKVFERIFNALDEIRKEVKR